MTSHEIYERFTGLQKRTGLTLKVIGEKYGFKPKTLNDNLCIIKKGEAGTKLREKFISLLEKLEQDYADFTLNCIICGKPFVLNRLGKERAKTCSDECAAEQHKRKCRVWKRNNKKYWATFKTCIVCGKQFEGSFSRKYCSKACVFEDHGWGQACKNCGKIIPRRDKVVFCSSDCRQEYKLAEAQRKRRKQKAPDMGWMSMDQVNNTLNSLEGGLY